jgi:hypothetical protein
MKDSIIDNLDMTITLIDELFKDFMNESKRTLNEEE